MSKEQVKSVKLGKDSGVQLKYSDSLLAFVDCQKDSESTGENGTTGKTCTFGSRNICSVPSAMDSTFTI